MKGADSQQGGREGGGGISLRNLYLEGSHTRQHHTVEAEAG